MSLPEPPAARRFAFERLGVVLPAHNEEAAIGETIEALQASLDPLGIDYEIIVVDDGSTDRTAAIVRAHPRVRLIQHRENRGMGAALKTGIRASPADVIAITDADGTYPVERLPDLLAELCDYDQVIGARRNEAGSLPWLRAPAKWFIRTLASYLMGRPIPDLNSGLRVFRREIALPFFGILPQGFSWVSTLTLCFMANGHPVQFVPIDYFERKGRSGFRPIRDTWNYLQLVFRTVMYFEPLKVFLPIALVLIVGGLLKAGADVIRYDWRIATGTVLVVTTGLQLAAIGLLADLFVRARRPD